MAAPTTGMDKAEMKQLLHKATAEHPLNFAFAQGKDLYVSQGVFPETLKLANGEGQDSLLKFDAAQIDPKVETIKLEDRGLQMSWGPQIYRVLLNSKQPSASGKWTYEFLPA